MPVPKQFVDLPRAPRKNWDVSEDYDPLAGCPPGLKPKYIRMAQRPRSGSLVAMVRLKCLDCAAWNSAEVARCEIRTCPLWARTRRISRQAQSTD